MAIYNKNLLKPSVLGQAMWQRFTNYVNADRGGYFSLQDFLNKIGDAGTIVPSKFEVSFSGMENLTFFVTDINLPTIRRNMTQVYFCGQAIEIPQPIEYEHDFSMTVLNDGNGVIYSSFIDWLIQIGGSAVINSDHTMTVRVLGDGINDYGMLLVYEGVRFKNIGGVRMSSTNSELMTFEVGGSAVRYRVIPYGGQTKYSEGYEKMDWLINTNLDTSSLGGSLTDTSLEHQNGVNGGKQAAETAKRNKKDKKPDIPPVDSATSKRKFEFTDDAGNPMA